VLDGRDIGTVIAPDADVKLFVTASVPARAHRRWQEMRRRGSGDLPLEAFEAMLAERDARDAERSAAPLRPAEDAIILDTSDMDAGEAMHAAIGLVSGHNTI
jgi:CMP/dCMP kinase